MVVTRFFNHKKVIKFKGGENFSTGLYVAKMIKF